jgi:gluconokinase
MVIIVMGVSGAGKSVVGRLLAQTLGMVFAEGDGFHPPANVEKMRDGTPLTDDDRLPWLADLAAAIDGWRAEGRSTVLTCSALKRRYRDIIKGGRDGVLLVHLKGSEELIRSRLSERRHEYMPASLLASQFATLEEPDPSENPVAIDIAGTPEAIVSAIVEHLPIQEA